MDIIFSIGNDELENKQPLGDMARCKVCGKMHKVRYGKEVLEDGTKVPSKLLAFISCGDRDFLVGVNGKEV